MSRVAYVMNGIMGKFGVSGKAFIPMLLGFGCSVPAIMSTRSLESMKDRRRVMFVIPFMSCGAKLPIYVLFSGMFFPDNAALAAFSMYLIGFAAGIISAFIIHKSDKNKEKNTLLIELPEYKSPSVRTILIYVWDKVKDYLSRAGTVIFIASVIVWFIMHFGLSGYTKNINESFGAVFGKYLIPVLNPVGLGFWQAGIALIAGLAAKEIVAASFAILFGISNLTSHGGMNLLSAELNNIGFGALNAYCLMLFSLLYPENNIKQYAFDVIFAVISCVRGGVRNNKTRIKEFEDACRDDNFSNKRCVGSLFCRLSNRDVVCVENLQIIRAYYFNCM